MEWFYLMSYKQINKIFTEILSLLTLYEIFMYYCFFFYSLASEIVNGI